MSEMITGDPELHTEQLPPGAHEVATDEIDEDNITTAEAYYNADALQEGAAAEEEEVSDDDYVEGDRQYYEYDEEDAQDNHEEVQGEEQQGDVEVPEVSVSHDEQGSPANADSAKSYPRPRETLLNFLSKKVTTDNSAAGGASRDDDGKIVADGSVESLHQGLASSEHGSAMAPHGARISLHRRAHSQQQDSKQQMMTPRSVAEIEKLAAEALEIADTIILKPPAPELHVRIGFEEKLWDSTLVTGPAAAADNTKPLAPSAPPPTVSHTSTGSGTHAGKHGQDTHHQHSRNDEGSAPATTTSQQQQQIDLENARKLRLATLRKKRNQSLMDGLRNRDFDVHFVEMIQHLPVEQAVESISKYYQEGKHLLYKQVHDAQIRAAHEVARLPIAASSRRRISNVPVMREPVMPTGTDASRRQVLAAVLQKRREHEANSRSQQQQQLTSSDGSQIGAPSDRRRPSLSESSRRRSSVAVGGGQLSSEYSMSESVMRPPVLRSLRYRRHRTSSVSTQQQQQQSKARGSDPGLARDPLSDASGVGKGAQLPADDEKCVEDIFVLFFKSVEKMRVSQLMDSSSPFRFIGEMSFCYMLSNPSLSSCMSIVVPSIEDETSNTAAPPTTLQDSASNALFLGAASSVLATTGITKTMVKSMQDEAHKNALAALPSSTSNRRLSTNTGAQQIAVSPPTGQEFADLVQQKLLLLLHETVERFLDEGGVEKRSGCEGFCFFTSVTSFGRIVDEVEYKGLKIRVSRTGLIEDDAQTTGSGNATTGTARSHRSETKPVMFTLGPSDHLENAKPLGRVSL